MMGLMKYTCMKIQSKNQTCVSGWWSKLRPPGKQFEHAIIPKNRDSTHDEPVPHAQRTVIRGCRSVGVRDRVVVIRRQLIVHSAGLGGFLARRVAGRE